MSLADSTTGLDFRAELRLLESGQQLLDTSFDRVVVGVANHMQTDVGSLYMLEASEESLLLVATVGLLQSCVGSLRMRLNEGLVGLAAEQKSPVVFAKATEHPRFKYFPEADEDEYQSFLGVPLLDGNEVLGVLVVQTIEARQFTELEVQKLQRVANLLLPLARCY